MLISCWCLSDIFMRLRPSFDRKLSSTQKHHINPYWSRFYSDEGLRLETSALHQTSRRKTYHINLCWSRVCSDDGLRLETSALQTPNLTAKNIPYQPLLIKSLLWRSANTRNASFTPNLMAKHTISALVDQFLMSVGKAPVNSPSECSETNVYSLTYDILQHW